MNIQNITLMELCETNCFTDSEEEETSDSGADVSDIEEDASDSEEDASDSEEEYIIKKQPLDTKNDKITIIVDGFYNNKTEETYDDWENIEFAELDDVLNDPSSNLFTNKKKL